MTTIRIKDIKITGYDLFSDTESFLKEVTDEAEQIIGGAAGGCTKCSLCSYTCKVTVAAVN
jgi:hypothetical protein